MLKGLIRFSLNNRGLVIVASALLLVIAGMRINSMPVDVFPELNAPTVVILTESGGLSADDVENNVSIPIEAAMSGMPGVRRVRSASAISLSIVWIEFEWGEDIYRARQLVSERLSGVAESLPEEAHPEIAPMTSITGEIMLLSLSSKLDESGKPIASGKTLRSFAEFDITNRLSSVPGVAKVVSIGGDLPEYQVILKQEAMRLYGITYEEVVEAAAQAHSTEAGGFIVEFQGKELPIRQEARVRNVEDLANTVIRHDANGPLTLGQVAEVKFGTALKRGTGAETRLHVDEDGNPIEPRRGVSTQSVVLSVQKAPGTNTLKLTEAIDKELDAMESALPRGAQLNRHVMRQSDFINLSLSNLLVVLRDAVIFVALVLMLFLLNARTTFITLTALPLSLGVALLVLWGLGLTINVMTLGGLAVAIGELVDDAIIDVENVFKRLQENRALPEDQRKSALRVVYDASNEIRSSVVFATIIIVLVFTPLLFLQGLEGRFFQPLGISYIVALMASLLVALTVTPVLCRMLLGGDSKLLKVKDKEGAVVAWLKRVYTPVLNFSLKFRLWLFLTAFALAGLAGYFATTFGSSFLPKFNEGTFTVFLMAPPGTSLRSSDRLAQGVEERIAEIEGVRAVVRRTGRAENDEHAEPVSSSEIEVSMAAGSSREEVRAEIDKVLAKVPGITTMVGQPIEHRLSHVMSGTTADIAINVYGDDLDVLRKLAKQIEAKLKTVPGARDVNANREVMIETLPVEFDQAELSRAGLTHASAASQVSAAFLGERVTTINDGVKRYGLVVRLDEEERSSPEDLKNLLLIGAGGEQVRLADVARVGREQASNLIARENVERKATVSLNVGEGANLGDLVKAVQQEVDPIVAEAGYRVEYGGQFEAQQSAQRTIMILGAIVLVIMLMLLVGAFRSMKAALLVLVNLPLALIGGVAAVALTVGTNPFANFWAFLTQSEGYIAPVISISTMVGFVSVIGIAVRNGILLVNAYLHLMREEGMSAREAIIKGSQERLIPILMTAITAILGMIPLAMAAGEPGSELLAPLAIVVLGGLTSSTLLNLIVVPAGFLLVFGNNNADFVEPERL